MLLVHRAANLPEAQLIADLLDAAGITSHIFNRHAQSIVGEIPPAVACPQVWIDDDSQLARARRLIAEHQAQPVAGTRRCRFCGEENPANFLSCWHCGAAMH